MATEQPENPPAFPNHPSIQIDGGPNDWTGMTLRDWFAGQAIPAIIAATSAGQHSPGKSDLDGTLTERMAADAYDIADAMLKARRAAIVRATGEA